MAFRGFISRADAGLRPPRSVTRFQPSFGTSVHWEGPPMGWPWSHAACHTKVRGIQAFHMGPSRGWTDIAYTAIACGHGYIFEGRGVGARTAANGTNVGNRTGYAICALLGQGDGTPEDVLDAIGWGVAWLRRDGHAGPGLNGHRDWKSTECPGSGLYGSLATIRQRAGGGIVIVPGTMPGTGSEESEVPRPNDVIQRLPAGPNGADPRAHYVLRANGRVEHHGTVDYGDYPRLKPEFQVGDLGMWHSQIWLGDEFENLGNGVFYSTLRTDGSVYQFGPGTKPFLR